MRRRWYPLFLVPVLALIGLGVLLIPRPAPAAPSLVAGTVFDQVKPAAPFSLRDQSGRVVTLASLRGAPVVVTFLEANCTELCPVVADDIRLAARNVRRSGGSVSLVAISTDPEGDTPAAIRRFLAKHGGAAAGWHFLTGSRAELTPVWRQYYIYAAPANAPASIKESHTSATYIIDSHGGRRGLFLNALDPRDLARDLRILDGLPASPADRMHVAAVPGSRAPPFALASLGGPAVSASSLRGHVVLLNFWASWCHPCRQETPLLEREYERNRAAGLTVVGIDREESAGAVKSFKQALGLRYQLLLDRDASVTNAYLPPGFAGLPFSVLIDATGTVVATREGQVDPAWLHAHVTPLLGPPSARG